MGKPPAHETRLQLDQGGRDPGGVESCTHMPNEAGKRKAQDGVEDVEHPFFVR